ncbi:MAG: ABC transporter permease [Candidatus Thermoplasmatota archaeon]
MRRLPWHVAVRADRKAVLTSLGVALGVAFSVISFAVPYALEAGTVSPGGPFGHADAIVARPAGATFDASTLGLLNATRVLVSSVQTDSGVNVTLVAFDGPRAPPVGPLEARLGRAAPPLAASFTVKGHAFTQGPSVDDPLIAPKWVIVTPTDLRSIDASFEGQGVTYVLVPRLAAEAADSLRAQGYEVGYAPGIEPFFQQSASEVARDLLLVVAFSSILVALFSYEFLRSEVREKRREIGLWRSLGMRSGDVMALLLARAGAIVTAGILVGSALAALAIAGASRATGSAVFALHIDPVTAIALVISFLLAGLLGGLVPAWTTSRREIREQLEAAV